jgi:hypothetical protein
MRYEAMNPHHCERLALSASELSTGSLDELWNECSSLVPSTGSGVLDEAETPHRVPRGPPASKRLHRFDPLAGAVCLPSRVGGRAAHR